MMKTDITSEMLSQHARWVLTKGKEGTRIDLRGANLDGANLDGAYVLKETNQSHESP